MNLKRSAAYLTIFISVFYFSNNVEIKAQEYVLESIVASSGTMPSVAYSVRKLTSTYTGPAIRVRRSTDNAEQDIAFVNDELDQTALLAFVGAGNSGFITTWYDQSGNGNHATNTTAVSQPRIVNAGVVDMLNSKPAVRTTLTTQFLDFNYVNSGRLLSTNAVASMNSNTARNGRIVGFATVAGGNDGGSANAFSLGRVNALLSEVRILRTLQLGFANVGGYDLPTVLTTTFDNANTNRLFVNGAIQSTVTNAVNANNFNITIGRLFNTTASLTNLGWVGLVPEIIIFNSTLSNTQQQILERNQASFYNLTPRITYAINNNFTYGSNVTINPTSAANVGTYTVTPTLPAGLTLNPTTGQISGSPTGVSSSTYTITNTNSLGSGTFAISLNVNAAPLTVTALTQTKVYGDVLTTTGVSGGTYTVTGFVNGEAAGTLSLTYSGNPSGDLATASVGDYTITPGGLTLSSGELASTKYNITYVTSTLRVNAAPLTVTALDQTKEYGTNLTNTTSYTQFSSAGLKNGESIGSVSVSYASGGTGTSTVGAYNNAIVISSATAGTFTSTNYFIIYQSASLTVNPANLSITATDQTKIYGASLTNGNGYLLFNSTGLKNGESIGSVSVSYVAGSTSTSTVNIYVSAIQISNAIGGTFTSTNYTISYNSGTLTVNQAPLTVTALTQTKVYGGVLSITGVLGGTYTITGLVNGEAAGTLSLTYSGNPAGNLATASVGNYTITPSGFTLTTGIVGLANYSITYVIGTLRVNAAPLTVTALTQTKVYGDILSTTGVLGGTYSITGLVNGQAAGTLSLTYSGSPTGDLATAAAGNYTITPASLTLTTGIVGLANYSITYLTGTLRVNAAPLTVTAPILNVIYGDLLTDLVARNDFKFTVVGLKNNDSSNQVLNGLKLATNYTIYSQVDSNILINFDTTKANFSRNYIINFRTGRVIVAKSNLRIKVSNIGICEGISVDTALSNAKYTLVGLKNGETQSDAIVGRIFKFITNYTSQFKSTSTKAHIYPDLSTITSNNYNLIIDTGYILIDELPILNNISIDANCNKGLNTFNYIPENITDGTVPKGTKYSWVYVPNSSIGGASNSLKNEDSIGVEQNLSNLTNSIIDFLYLVTPVNNACVGKSFKFIVKVKPLPFINQPPNLTLCPDEKSNILFSGSLQNDIKFFWTNTNSLIGLDTTGVGSISFIPENSTNKPILASISVKPFSNGCFGLEKTFRVNVNPTPKLPEVLNANQSICSGDVSKEVKFIDTVGTKFKWVTNQSRPNIARSGSGNIPAFSLLNTGSNPINIIYTVTPELNGCQGAPAIVANISINPPIVNKIDRFPSYACPDLPVGPFAVESTTGGNFLSYNYTWEYSKDSIGVYAPINNRQGSVITAPMQDSVSWYRVMTESGGCKYISPSVKVLSRKAPNVKINLNTSNSIIGIGNSVQVFTTGAEQYEWFPKTGVSNAYISSPFLGPLTTTKYTVVGTDNFGCINKDTLSVQVAANYSIEPNNVITPNGDNINDTWEIKNIKFYQNNKITLYNNQGNLIKVFDKYTGGWDGSINNRRLPIGNYYYIISLEGGKSTISGSLTVIY